MSSLGRVGKRSASAFGVIVVIIAAKVGYRVYQQVQQSKPQSVSFAEARAAHVTTLLVSEAHDSGPLPELYTEDLEYTHYEGPLGEMSAIATPVGETGAMMPAIVWVTGGFGGIADGVDLYDSPENDQGIASFLDRDIVVFLPAFRGEHENPGVFECFYGEVDDLVSAVEHVAKRVDVDPERIYLMGHSNGGTNALLASLLTDIPVGVVSFGAVPDMEAVISDGQGFEVEPYDIADSKEVMLRSAIRYTQDIQVPVLYIEGVGNPFAVYYARKMELVAKKFGVDFKAAIIQDADHYNVLRPIKDMLAERIESGSTKLPSPVEVQEAYTEFVENPDNHLLEVVASGSETEIRKILQAGADPNVKSAYGWPAVMVAANDNDADVVSALLEAGADVNAKSPEDGTPLIVACIRNQENVKVLLDAGAEVNVRDGEGVSALGYAAMYADEASVIELLIAAGADVDARDDWGYTALMIASLNTKNERIILELIEAGSDVNARTENTVTTLMIAAKNTVNPEVVVALLDAKADARVIDSEGYSTLDYADNNEALSGTKAYEMLVEASR